MVSVGNAQIILNGEGGEEIYPLDLHGIFYKVQRVAFAFPFTNSVEYQPMFLCLAGLTCLTVRECCGSVSWY